MNKHLLETTGHQRLLLGAAVGLTAGMVPSPLSVQTQTLMAWCLGAGSYLFLAWWLAVTLDATQTRERAQAQDQPGLIVFGLMFLSVFASSAAIAFMMHGIKDLSTIERYGHVALSILALGASWLLMQSIFSFRYAHLYYEVPQHGRTHGGGLEFPGKQEPDYFDFMYYAHVVGMTSQVSDVVVSSRGMRRLTLIHSISAFVFNILVLALGINLTAGAIS